MNNDARLEPPDEKYTAEQYDYINRSTRTQQVTICREYLEHVGYDGFNEWLWEWVLKNRPEMLMEYCEKQESFWRYLE